MKNQGVWVTRILSLVICLFVVSYMGYHVIASLKAPLRTVTAVLAETAESLSVSGIVVRNEDTMPLPAGLFEITVDEAERVSAGQTIAVTYQSEIAHTNSMTLREKTAQRELLSYIAKHSDGVVNVAELDSELRLKTAEFLADISAGKMSALQQQTVEIRTLLFRQAFSYEGSAVLMPSIERLDEEIASLTASVASASAALKADKPGLFSAMTDGLEAVWTPEVLKDITVSSFRSLSEHRPLPPDEGTGRLVRGWTWRFSCLMPAYQAKTLPKQVNIRFSDGFNCTMTAESVSAEEDGQCVTVFSSDRYIDRFISERWTQCEIIYSEYEGVRIPSDGLRLDTETGEYYVYCLVLGRVDRKNVTLYSEIERDNYFLAKYSPESSANLLPGDEIIVAGKDLFDGKIIA